MELIGNLGVVRDLGNIPKTPGRPLQDHGIAGILAADVDVDEGCTGAHRVPSGETTPGKPAGVLSHKRAIPARAGFGLARADEEKKIEDPTPQPARLLGVPVRMSKRSCIEI